jgi:hypothetical protein
MLRPRSPDDGLFGFGARFSEGGPTREHTIGFVNGSTLDTKSGAHYLSPFLTCMECNQMQAVNVATVSRALSLIPRGSRLPLEVLPVCMGCGRTDQWSVGAHDFEPLIGMDKDAYARMFNMRRRAVIRIPGYRRCTVDI